MARKTATLFVVTALSLAASGASASSFPWTVNEAGFDNPAAMAYAEKHRIGGTRTGESAIPWSVNEAGPYVPDSVPTPNRPALRTAGQ